MSRTALFVLLVSLVILSAFFSSSETGMMSLNRYRLRHKAKKNDPAAIRVQKLLERPDRILGVILIGNTFANICASSVATILAVKYLGDIGVAVATIILTLVILIFAEVTPKTLAAMYPERVAYPASILLRILLYILYPLVWITNAIANGLLSLFKVKVKGRGLEALSHEELRTVVNEAVGKTSAEYQEMLLGILDLNSVTVEDIMVPRNEIVGINLDDNWKDIQQQLQQSQHTRLPVYKGTIESIVGMLHMRKVLHMFAKEIEDKHTLERIVDEVYMIPEATPLNTLLVNFKEQKVRIGLVVDEYGDILGLATLEDILEEIVGEFTTDFSKAVEEVKPQKDGSFIVEGGVNVRELNRNMNWELPTTGPKTLSGLIIEHLELIPSSKICVKISGYPIEVLTVDGNTIETVQVWPALRKLHDDKKKHIPE